MQPKRVALLIETSTSWGAQIIAGVSDFIRRHERWVLYVDQRGVFEPQSVPAWWEGDGIIARVTSRQLVQHVRVARTPCVNVSQIRIPSARIQQVTTDESLVGDLAADTLLAAGLRSFAYYGPPQREYYRDNVLAAFAAALATAGCRASVFNPDRLLRSDTTPHLNLSHLVEWLRKLEKPVGVLAWNTLGAHRVGEACCWASIRVPEDVSILAGDHDQLIAEIASPRLSCIDHAPRRVGYLAAAELARLMSGGNVGDPVLVAPEGVIGRESVASGIVKDELVAQALRFIRANARKPIGIADILERVPASRRNLELRFRRELGRGPIAELRRVRVSLARRLLAETEHPIKRVAIECGFATTEQLQRLLRTETSLSPSEYRETHRRSCREAAGQAAGLQPPPARSLDAPSGLVNPSVTSGLAPLELQDTPHAHDA